MCKQQPVCDNRQEAVLFSSVFLPASRVFRKNCRLCSDISAPLLRVTNTGPSAIIGASGQTVPGTLTPSYRPEARAATLYITNEQTIYSRYGNVFLYFLYCLVLCELIKSIWLRNYP
jgi:hypothetical protein